MGEYTTGTGQVMGAHDPDDCDGRNCVIHNPSDHSMREFQTHWRQDRQIMERICPHGVGHPDPDDQAYRFRRDGDDADTGVHGCDGCCHEPDPE